MGFLLDRGAEAPRGADHFMADPHGTLRSHGTERVSPGALLTTFIGALLFTAAPARDVAAQVPRTASLRVTGGRPDDCPDAAALREDVRRRIGRDGFAEESSRQITVRFDAGRRARRTARLELHEPGERDAVRTLSQPGPGCAELAGAVALAVALIIDPETALRPPAATSQAPQPTPTPVCPVVECPTCAVCPAPPPLPPPRVPRPSPAPPAPPIWLRLAGGSSLGLDPSPSVSVGLSIDVGLSRRWGLQVGALLVPARATDDGVVGVGRTFARAGACHDWSPGPVRLGLCAGAMAGAVHLSALALQPVDPGDRPWAGLWFDAHAHVALGRSLSLGLQARGVVPVLSWAARVEGRGEPSFEPSPIAFEGDVTLGVRLR